MTLRRIRLVAFLSFLLLVAASVGVTFTALQSQREDALVINLAGRQRMLIQKMTLEVMGVQANVNPLYRQQLSITESAYFEQTLAALIDGGEAPYNEGTIVTLPPTRDTKILDQLKTVRATWGEMAPAIHIVLGAELQSAEMTKAVATVSRLSPVILSQMDEAVRMYEAEATREVERTQAIQIGFLAMAVALLVVALPLTERRVLGPIARLDAAALRIGEGDLATPVSVSGPLEIEQLARSFDDMRRNLAASREESERHAQEQAALLKLSQALLAESNPQAMMDLAVNVAAEALKVELAAAALIDPDGQSYSGRAFVGWPPEIFQQTQRIYLTAGTGLGYVIQTRKPTVVLDEARETRFGAPSFVAQAGITSSLLVPMLAGEEAIGGLVVNSRSSRSWSDDEVRLLSLIANETAQALGRAWQHAHAVERLERISALHDIDVAIMLQLDLEKRLDILLEKVVERLRVDAAAVALIDPDTHELNYAARRGLDGEFFADGLLKVNEGIAGQVAHSGEVAAIPDVSAEPRFARRSIAGRSGIVSYLAVPLRARGAIIGVLELATRTRHEFLSEEIDFFVTLAGQAAVALENARLYHEAQERLERISSLHDIDVAITSPLGLQATLDVLLEKVTERLGVDTAAVALAAAVAFIDQETRELVYVAKRGLDGEFFVNGLLKVNEGIAGRVAHTGEAAAIPDVRAEAGFARAAIAERLGIVSYLAVPLQARGEILGVLELATRQRHAFAPEEVDFFVTLAGQAAIVIDNSRMYEEAARRASQQRALAENAGSILATLDTEALWPVVGDAAQKVLAADRVAVYLYHADTDLLTCPYASGLSAEYVAEINRRFREVPGGWLLADPRPVVSADAQTDPAAASIRDLAAREGFHSYGVFPLMAPSLPLGAFVVYRDRVAPFTPDDIATGQTLAHVVAVALQNARLFKAERTAREQAETLRLATQALSASLDLQKVFDLILSELRRVVPYDSASVQQLEGERLEIIGGYGFQNPKELLGMNFDVRASDSPNGEVIRTRAPLILEDAPAIYEEFRVGPHAAAGIRSWLGVPLLFGDRLIGMIALDKQEPGFYTADHACLALAFAAQAAVAIENARLFESLTREQHNTVQLYHLSLELAGSFNPQEIANRALEAAASAVGVSRGNILTLEEDGEHLRFLAVTGYDWETVDAINQRLDWDINRGVTGRIVRTRTATIVPDVSRDADWVAISGLDDWVQSILSVPLVAGNRVVGALNLLSEQPDFFKIENLSLVAAIASPVALSLQNARLYESLRQRLAELEILADTSSALRKAQSYNDMSPILLAKAVEGLKANAGVLLLLENNALKFATIYGEASVSIGDTCPPDAGMMWQALESGSPLFIPDVTQIEELHKSAVCQALMGDALSCACVPLRTTTSAIGVIFLNWKKKYFLSADESRLLESLAEIAANAIHRSTLYEQTVRQALDLIQAYDATIEGWSRALDLRDRETEGHSQRVTELTLELARAIGINESEIEHIRRGALLHDIGKMGIPDNILHKAGALSDEEWTIMRRHPQLAYEMLSPITYLQNALGIPYCHHEKWDGTGYPRGLKGEEIPLTARIFAMVDVYDALTSDRPYRPAWTKRKAAAYIRQQAGLHFDPKVVDIFLKMIRKK